MAPILIDAALRGALVALLVLVAVSLAPVCRRPGEAHRAAVGIALALSLIVQALAASHWAEYEWSCLAQSPGIGVSLGAAVVFWLFAQAEFNDDFRLRPWHGGVWAAVALHGAMVCTWMRWPAPAPAVGYTLMRAVPIVFTLLTVVAVAAPWRADLVERRRRWRGVVVAGGGWWGVCPGDGGGAHPLRGWPAR